MIYDLNYLHFKIYFSDLSSNNLLHILIHVVLLMGTQFISGLNDDFMNSTDSFDIIM